MRTKRELSQIIFLFLVFLVLVATHMLGANSRFESQDMRSPQAQARVPSAPLDFDAR